MTFLDRFRPKHERTPQEVKEPASSRASSFFSTHMMEFGGLKESAGDVINRLMSALPKAETVGAMDSSDSVTLKMAASSQGAISEALAMWYASQGFIGYQLCAILSQHWLISRACTMPGRDAIRKGFDIVSVDEEEIDPAVMKALRNADKAMRLKWNLEQFIRFGRIFGIRIALFKVESDDLEYYEKPFNIDGVKRGSYKGIVQVDPYWHAPLHSQSGTSQPDSMHFYDPEWWQISGRKYHRSHLIIYRHCEPPDLLKPQYLYGGIPVPQMIMERVYGAERTANETTELVQTKRMNVWLTDLDKVVANGDEAMERMAMWTAFRNNHGIKLGDKDGDEFHQFDTSLGDLDNVVMTNYQLVASAAGVPSTKLLGTSPKGFDATGEFEEKSYHEELESIQEHDMTPFVERHHAMALKSAGIEPDTEITIAWRPLRSQSPKEMADENLIKAQTGQALINSGALSSEDERLRITTDKTSGYASLGLKEMPAPELDDDLEDDGPA